jgi:hypothetical protein
MASDASGRLRCPACSGDAPRFARGAVRASCARCGLPLQLEVRTEGDVVAREVSIAPHDPGYRAAMPVRRGLEINHRLWTPAALFFLALGMGVVGVAIASGGLDDPWLLAEGVFWSSPFFWAGLNALRSLRVVADERGLEIVSGWPLRRRRYRLEIDDTVRGAIAARENRLIIGGSHAVDLPDAATAALVARLLGEWLEREQHPAVRIADDLERDAAAEIGDEFERATPRAHRAR